LGTRPEIIKLAPIIDKLNKKNSTVIFTGQHYDFELSRQFFDQLGIRKPDYSLKISHSSPSAQMGEMMTKLPRLFDKLDFDTVIVQGDTNTVLAAAMSSLKCGIPVSHVESGLRSFDWRMPEEHNRVATDHISEMLFAPTSTSKNNLISEKAHGKIFVTGNTVIDAINKFSDLSPKTNILPDLYDFVLMTLHRAENVDDKTTLVSIIRAVLDSNEEIVFPIHPRTLQRLKKFGLYGKLLRKKNLHLIKSVGYLEILALMKRCLYIVTDSGGIQEEATSPKIRKKVIVTRKTTDRPEAVKAGFSIMAGTSYQAISAMVKQTSKNPKISNKSSPYGTGFSSQKIIRLIHKNL
jgi:UDP-N-acetylglucosamine 2-epimerase (non-hydrolysing)